MKITNRILDVVTIILVIVDLSILWFDDIHMWICETFDVCQIVECADVVQCQTYLDVVSTGADADDGFFNNGDWRNEK